MDKNLSDKFNLPTATDNGPDRKILMKPDDQASSDFDYVRENLYQINELSMEAIAELKQLAVSSQQARAYEVLATLIGRSIESNKAFYELRKQRKDLEGVKDPTTINNNLTLTTEALNRLLSKTDPETP